MCVIYHEHLRVGLQRSQYHTSLFVSMKTKNIRWASHSISVKSTRRFVFYCFKYWNIVLYNMCTKHNITVHCKLLVPNHVYFFTVVGHSISCARRRRITWQLIDQSPNPENGTTTIVVLLGAPSELCRRLTILLHPWSHPDNLPLKVKRVSV